MTDKKARLYDPSDPVYGEGDLVVAPEEVAVAVSRLAGTGMVLVLSRAQYDQVAAWFRRPRPKKTRRTRKVDGA